MFTRPRYLALNNMGLDYIKPMSILIIMLIALVCLLTQAFADSDLIITPSNPVIQAVTDYTIQVQLAYIDDPIPADSIIKLNIPNDYPSSPAQTYTCDISTWPISGVTLQCSIQFRVLTVTGGFPTSFSDFDDWRIFEWVLRDYQNPTYSQTTGVFSGEIVASGGTTVLTLGSISGSGLTISAGSIGVTMQVNPTTVDSNSILTITLDPQHTIPSSGYLKLVMGTYWQTNAFNTTNIIESSVTCLSANNTASNMVCSSLSTSSKRILTFTTILESDSAQPFSLSLSPFLNPPTTQPQGSFNLSLYDSEAENRLIDESNNNKLSGVTTKLIQNPGMSLASYWVGSSTQGNLSMTINSNIQNSDALFIQCPAELGLAGLGPILLSGSQVSNQAVDATNVISFLGVNTSPAITLTFTLDSITLPLEVTTVSGFNIYTKRNNFEIDRVDDAFTITTQPGTLTVQVAAAINEAGIVTDYVFSISSEHPLQTEYSLVLQFDSQTFSNILTTSSLSCQSSLKIGCSLAIVSNSEITVSNFTSASSSSLTVTITGIQNPYQVGNFSSIRVQSVNSNSKTVDQQTQGVWLDVQPRRLYQSNISISSTSLQTYSLTNLSITINNNNPLPTFSYIKIQLPAEMTVAGTVSCSPSCQSLGNSTVRFNDIPADGIVSIHNIRNPISTEATQSLRIQIVSNNDQLLQYIYSEVVYQSGTLSTLFSEISTNSTTNSDPQALYSIKVTSQFSVPGSPKLKLLIPSSMACDGCLTSSYNSSYYSVLIDSVTLTNSLKSAEVALLLHNHYSKEVQYVSVQLMEPNLVYGYGQALFEIENTVASAITFSYTFSPRQYKQLSSLTISSIAGSYSEVNSSNIVNLRLKLLLGSEYGLQSLVCTPTDYSCTVSGQSLTLQPLGTSLTPIQLHNITGPSTSPGSPIQLSTQSLSGFVIDSNSDTLVWTVQCVDPCKTCSDTDGEQCASCYADETLVAGRVLYYPANSSCVSDCGDLYFRNHSTNICEICSTSCGNCVNKTVCVSCPSGQYLLQSNNSCWSTCPPGYYSLNTICTTCTASLNCLQCSNQLSCSSCPDGYYFYSSTCLVGCPQLISLQNNFSNNCDPCPTNCTKCAYVDLIASCSQCQNGYLLDNGGCYLTCRSVGLVANGNLCTGCDASCLTCTGNTLNCLTCNVSSADRYFHSNQCLETCPSGYYPDDSLNLCVQCTQPCEYCTNSSVSSCLTCIQDYSLDGTRCTSACPEGSYSDGSSCGTCVSPCETCSSALICFTCADNHTLYSGGCTDVCPDSYVQVNQVCVQCSSNCKTCHLVNVCKTCWDSLYLYEGTCVQPCPSHYFEEDASLTCMECPFVCQQCENSTFCTSCKTGYQLSATYECTLSCPSAQVAIDSICTPCETNCTSCEETSIKCTSCVSTHYYDPTNNRCSEWCTQPSYVLQTNKSCLTVCPEPTYVSNSVQLIDGVSFNLQSCVSCPALCTQCLSDTVCSTCETGASLSNLLCLQSCPSAAPYSINSVCKTCNVAECYECSGDACLQCGSGYLLIGDSLCIGSCGSDGSYDSANKQCVATSATSVQSILDLNFVPFPYILLAVILAVIYVLVHFTHGIGLVPMFLASTSCLLTLCCLTTLIAYYSYAATATLSSSTVLGSYLLICAVAGIYVLNCTGVGLYLYAQGSQKWGVAIASSLIHYKLLAVLCANIDGYNAYAAPYWRHFGIVLKVSFLLEVLGVITGVVFALDVTNSNYLYYSAIQIVILSITTILISVGWVVWPNHKPPEFRPDESLENIFKEYQSQFDVISSKDNSKDSQAGDRYAQSLNVKYKDSENLSAQAHHSEFPRNKEVAKLSNSKIEQGLADGVYRKDKAEYDQQIRQEEEQNNLDSAAKLNAYLNNKRLDQELRFDQYDEVQTKAERKEESKEKERKPKHNFAVVNEPIAISDVDLRQNIIFEQVDEENSDTGEEDNKDNDEFQEEEIEQVPQKLSKTKQNWHHPQKQTTRQKAKVTSPLVVKNITKKLEVRQRGNDTPTQNDNIFDQAEEVEEEEFRAEKSSRPFKVRSRFPKDKIIHADLESIGTVKEDSDNEDYRKNSPITGTEADLIFEVEEDLKKPSQMFRKTTNFLSKGGRY